jgi:hypothetical protein
MLKFLDAALHPERGPIHQAIALAREERAEVADSIRIGLNWLIRHAGSDTIVYHNGGTAGYRAFAGVVPSRMIGVVVLTNSGGAGADDIGFHLLNPELPLAPPANGPPALWAGIVVFAILAALLGHPMRGCLTRA